MAAKDKSASFDFGGTYTKVEEHACIEYNLGDVRTVKVIFESVPEGTHIIQTFDMESQNSEERQRSGWQAILDNFKKYVEGN